MTSEPATPYPVSRRGNILIEENLTPMQKLVIYLVFTGVLFLRSVSFYYQEADYADPDHPQHEHYNDTVINKRVNLAAAVLVFMWYLYNTFFMEPFYHKYVTRRSQLLNSSSPGQKDGQQHQPSEEEKRPKTGLYDNVTQETEDFLLMDMRNPKIPFYTKLVDEQTIEFTSNEPKSNPDLRSNRPKLTLPKKMTLDEFFEWSSRELAFDEIPIAKEPDE